MRLLLAECVSQAWCRTAASRLAPPRRPDQGGGTSNPSDLRLLGDLQGVIDLDAEVPHGRLELGVPQEQLHGA